MPPRRLGPYLLVSVIGRGGLGTVYRARHLAGGAPAAVKVLGPAAAVEATAARRLEREYAILRRLDHPNVVRALACGERDGWWYLAMELVEGLDLRAYLSPALDGEEARAAAADDARCAPSDHGPAAPRLDGRRALAAMLDEPGTEDPRPPLVSAAGAPVHAPAPPAPLAPAARAALNHPGRVARLRSALAQVAEAVAYVHGEGFVHRDLKPSNVMVDDARRVRLMDFGLVKAAREPADAAELGHVVGTCRYMSPEQARGEPVDARSDLYSLGVILYELLAGAPPFTSADPVALWREIRSHPPPPLDAVNPEADPRLCALAHRLLDKDPARRCQGAGEVAAVLREGDAPAGLHG